MGTLVLGAFRTVAIPPATPVNMGSSLMWIGDSQSNGYGTGTCKNHATAMCRIMQTKGLGPANIYTSVQPISPAYIYGASGVALSQSRAHYDLRTQRLTASYKHIQESGSQSADAGAQDTAAKYKAIVKTLWIQAETNSAGCVKVTESSFSFGREAEQYRDWGPYNVVLREAKTELLAENGITLYIAETDRDIKLLQAQITNAETWFQSNESNPYHYKSVGNLMVALSTFRVLNITVSLADLAGITEVSEEWKQICLNVIGVNP